VLHPLAEPPLPDAGQLRDLPLRHPVHAEDRDDNPEIPPGARLKDILPREDPLHDPAHLRNSQAHGATPFSWLPAGQYGDMPGDART
jgi:hypothetical protein